MARVKPDRNRIPTPLGWRQADRLGQLLAGYEFDIVLSSPADRAVLTAHHVVGKRGIPVIALDELYPDPEDGGIGSEMEQEYWSKLPYGPLHAYLNMREDPMFWFAARAQKAIESCAKLLDAKRILVVSHAVILQAIAWSFETDLPASANEHIDLCKHHPLLGNELGEAEAFVFDSSGATLFIRNDVAE